MASRIRRAIVTVFVALGLAASLQPAPASAAEQVDVSLFHDRLAPYGNWIKHPRYGWVWYSTGVEVGWRPYFAKAEHLRRRRVHPLRLIIEREITRNVARSCAETPIPR